ncbi:MAG: glycosyltransferase family 2 protein [Thermodesulfobacteriota bacterium]
MQILVLVPVYNEWPHLLPILKGLRTYFSHILVVDDGSPDKSFLSHLETEGFPYLRFPFNLGHWNAIQAGFRYGLTKGFEGVITCDGDGQHLPGEAHKIAPHLEEGFDVVIGSDKDRGNWNKKLCWRVLNGLSGLKIRDFTSGLRGYSRPAMETLLREPFLNLDYQDLGVLFMAQKQGLNMMEVPVRMQERAGEKSKVFPSLSSVFRYFFITLTFILVRRL